MRYLRVPVGERGSAADNRHAVAALKLVGDWDRAMSLPDEASVLVRAEECRYPHLVRDGDAYLVRVLADMPSEQNVALTVFRTTDRFDAFQLLQSLEEYLRDSTVEVAEVGRFGSLKVSRTTYRPVIMPENQKPAEVASDA